jgi:uncharacterized protein (TIGR01440 family)
MSVIGDVSDINAAFIQGCADEFRAALLELIGRAFDPVRMLVVGCSTSEIAGNRIGSRAYPVLGDALALVAVDVCRAAGIALAAQCCEHLNRALVVERDDIEAFRLQRVMAVPCAEAGGSFAAGVYGRMEKPALAEGICAGAGIDIGGTLIGMHLARVAVPVRLAVGGIGLARITAAVTRPPYVGGERARYG